MQKILGFNRNGINYHVFEFTWDNNQQNENNEQGTIKDIGAYETIEHAVNQGFNVIVNITSGNNGEALKRAAFTNNQNKPLEERVRLVHICPDNPEIVNGLSDSFDGFEYSIPYASADLRNKWLTEEDRISIAERVLQEHKDERFKVKSITDVTHYIPNEYVKQAEEILLHPVNGKHLDYLAIPVGTGRTYLAFYYALNNLKIKGFKINTKLIGIVPKGENPIFNRFLFARKNGDGIEYIITNYHPSSKADKLSCPNTDLMPELELAIADGHYFIAMGNEIVGDANNFAFKKGRAYSKDKNMNNPLELEDSASVGFSLVYKDIAEAAGINKGDNVGIFTTGRGLYASPSYVLEKAKIERRKELIGKVKYGTLISAGFATLLAVLGGIDYYVKRFEQRSIHQQQVEIIYEIAPNDPSMVQAFDEIGKKYGTSIGGSSTELTSELAKEVILKYLELNKEKFSTSNDPIYTTLYSRLKFLLEDPHKRLNPASK